MKLEQEAIGPPKPEYSGHFQPSKLSPVGVDPLLKKYSSTQKMGGSQEKDSIKEEWGKYLALKILAMRVFGCCKSLQHCLASKALLKVMRSLKPNPPADFAFPIFS
jgi:hypothetical protein